MSQICVHGEVRDEFLCPITRELLIDPVIASDGHTYERSAIVQWLTRHVTSPKTSEEISVTNLVPNLNLRRLIEDIIQEGGHSLYQLDPHETMPPKLKYLTCQPVLSVETLEGGFQGSWIIKSSCGPAALGRNRSNSISFPADLSISREHCCFGFEPQNECFYVCDAGSAGGTFVRVHQTKLQEHTRFKIGRHEFTVTRILPFRISLQCSGPQGSPIHQRSYSISDGSIGRDPSNQIALYATQNGKLVSVDSEISNKHARIEYDPNDQSFKLLDGDKNKPSKNGCWIKVRTGTPHFFEGSYSEVLVGEKRLGCTLRRTIAEALEEDV